MTAMLLSMTVFALVASASPGPVNIVALASGTRYGFRASLSHVTGATIGFVLLLLCTGLGLQEVLTRWAVLTEVLRWAGIAFLLYLAWRLASDDGRLGEDDAGGAAPSLWHGALMQWLNPKAWLAALAGTGVYVAGDAEVIWVFAAVYLVVCYVSIAAWAYAGTHLRRHLREARHVRLFNRTMAALLLACIPFLV